MLLNELHGTGLVFVLVFLVPPLAAYVLLDSRAGLLPAGEREGAVDLLGLGQGVGLEVFKLHLDEVARRDAALVGLILVVELGVDAEDVVFKNI